MPQIINNWPYSDLHNINLDWILGEIKRLGIKVENVELFMPHVANWNNGSWDVDHDYNMNEIVFNGNDIYIAIKNVPAGENINNTDYWALIGTDCYITQKVDKAGDTMTGNLTLPNVIVKAPDALSTPAVMGRNSNNQSLGTVDFLNDGQVQIRSYNVGVASENYKLPTPTESVATEYEILTSKKTGVQIYTNGELTAVASGAVTNVATITLPAGIWIVQFVAVFESNATGYREIGLGASALDPYMNRYCKMAEEAANGIDTELSVTTVLVPSAETTYYLNVIQNSGSSLDVTGGIDARRLV